MKRLIFCLIMLLVLPIVLADVSVNHFVEETYEGEPIFVHVVARTDSNLDGFDIGEFIPETWEVDSWSVLNYEEKVLFSSENGEFLGKNHNINHWTFEDVSEDIALSFRLPAQDAGDYEFISVWFYPTGFEMETIEFTVKERNSNSPLTGSFIAEPEKPSNGVSTTVTIPYTVSDVLEDVNDINLY